MKNFVVKWNGTNKYECEAMRLMPGNNEVKADIFEKAKLSPGFKKRIKMGLIQVVEKDKVDPKSPEAPKKEQPETALDELGIRDAVDVVNETFDSSLLKKYLETETRKTVLKAIEKRIEELFPSSEEKEEEDE